MGKAATNRLEEDCIEKDDPEAAELAARDRALAERDCRLIEEQARAVEQDARAFEESVRQTSDDLARQHERQTGGEHDMQGMEDQVKQIEGDACAFAHDVYEASLRLLNDTQDDDNDSLTTEAQARQLEQDTRLYEKMLIKEQEARAAAARQAEKAEAETAPEPKGATTSGPKAKPAAKGKTTHKAAPAQDSGTGDSEDKGGASKEAVAPLHEKSILEQLEEEAEEIVEDLLEDKPVMPAPRRRPAAPTPPVKKAAPKKK